MCVRIYIYKGKETYYYACILKYFIYAGRHMYLHIYPNIHIYSGFSHMIIKILSLSLSLYIYIYIKTHKCTYIHMCVYIYIYIYIRIHTDLYIQCITKVSTLLTFLQIFKYISSWDNTNKMTL